MIKEKFEKAKNWIEENKSEIALCAYYGVVLIGGGILIGKSVKALKVLSSRKELPIPENWEVGKVTWLIQDKTGSAGFVANIPADKLDGIGEALHNTLAPQEFKFANIMVSYFDEELKV